MTMAMEPMLGFTRSECDEDMVDMTVCACDGRSSFSMNTYVGHSQLRDVAAGLQRFKDEVFGGILDIEFGKFGPEFAAGAFHARLHFQGGRGVFITLRLQSGFVEFDKREVASEATLYITTEPALLDDFVRAVQALSDGYRNEAQLQAMGIFP